MIKYINNKGLLFNKLSDTKDDIFKIEKNKTITDLKNDRYGYGMYVEYINNIIKTNNNGFIFAIFGKYGCGKTTLINFLNNENIKIVNVRCYSVK